MKFTWRVNVVCQRTQAVPLVRLFRDDLAVAPTVEQVQDLMARVNMPEILASTDEALAEEKWVGDSGMTSDSESSG